MGIKKWNKKLTDESPYYVAFCKKKSMKLYICSSDVTIGSMLAQEGDDGVERAIYYLKRVLNDA